MALREDVFRLKRSLEDALSNEHPNFEDALDILKMFKTMSIDGSILKETKIGVYINTLRKHDHEQIQEASKDLIAHWKNQVKVISRTSSNADEETKTPAPTRSTPRTPEAAELKRQSSGSPRGEPQTSTELGNTGNSTRDKIQELLFKALGKTEESEISPVDMAIAIEEAMFAHFKNVNEPYKQKYRDLAANLRDPNNEDLRKRVLSGLISPHQLVSMSTKDLASDRMKEEMQKLAQYNLDAARSDWAKQKQETTDQFKCGRCGQRRCTFYQLQTRSADEPMTTFVTCENCGNKFKC
eukprot:TRINITY_DN3257_c0_g1_i1.p1 TRINITY_DN3257_c0_g1~~TRINITY_DN3257_c0_g1_i1.p1  ORF type:complete len:315 (-),score=86.68 TRINITY_DN3257_c0_g1_i1:222-1112(-)